MEVSLAMGDEQFQMSPAAQLFYQTVNELRKDIKELGGELKGVTESIIQFKAQDLQAKITSVEKEMDAKIKEVGTKVSSLEKFQFYMMGAYGLLLFIILVLGLVADFRK